MTKRQWPLPEECLKRVPPALVRELRETVGSVDLPRPATPSIDFLEFPCNCAVGACTCPDDPTPVLPMICYRYTVVRGEACNGNRYKRGSVQATSEDDARRRISREMTATDYAKRGLSWSIADIWREGGAA